MSNRINHLAVLAAAVAFFAWGAVWFTIFGLRWAHLVGIDPSTVKPSAGPYILSFFMGWVLAYTAAIALTRHPEDQTVRQGVSFAIFMGIGLYASMLLNQYTFEQRPIGLWLIDAGYVVIGFAIVGAIVGGWKKRVAP